MNFSCRKGMLQVGPLDSLLCWIMDRVSRTIANDMGLKLHLSRPKEEARKAVQNQWKNHGAR